MRLDLNGHWKLLYRNLDFAAEQIAGIESADDFIDAGALPCDVRMPLIRDGVIKDPVASDWCYESEWVENKSWWFQKEFSLAKSDMDADSICLVLESLDLSADIFLNGRQIGTHQSCHYPFEAEVLPYAREGGNLLTVRLTDGQEAVSAEELQPLEEYICTEASIRQSDRGNTRRAFLRKPQYVYGWDWAPRIATIGIMKDAYLVIGRAFDVKRIHPVTLEAGAETGRAKMSFQITFESFRPIATADALVRLELLDGETRVLALEKEVLAQSGTNFINFDAEIENARLWWPNGAGEQPLYTVRAVVAADGREYDAAVQTGIRTIELNQEKTGEGRRKFAVKVNGVDIFCKGGNWIPADSLYARVTPEKYETLIREAKECNFNMLRVWGGGSYERDEFYDLCDRNGILVWHDFMFACALYPEENERFQLEVRREMDYQTKRLRHHPCIALWCGNNECQWIYESRFTHTGDATPSGSFAIYNRLAPEIIRANCPETPYWRSSPYGGGEPNANEAGDRHHWHDCTMNGDMQKRVAPEEYDKVTSAFVSEYGHIGPCSDESIQKYFEGEPVVRGSRVWNLHNNTFEKETVAAGIRKHYTDPDMLNLPDYLQYARLVQGQMYAYSLESIRFYEHSSGSLFWMYNDAWGEIGWSIIDYYLDRKPSYYYVKRAFAPVKLIMRPGKDGKDGYVQVTGVNDTPDTVRLNVEYGYAGFDGKYDSQCAGISLPAFSRGIALIFPLPDKDLRKGVVFARSEGIPPALLRTADFKEYILPESAKAMPAVEKVEAAGSDYHVTIKSVGYSHAVSFGTPASIRCSDAYFDMLPGERKTVILYDAAKTVNAKEIQAYSVCLEKDVVVL